MLTDREIKGLKPESKQYKKFDGQGLMLLVSPAGGKSWSYRYHLDGKDKMLVLGRYPDVGLLEARALRDDCARLVKAGRDPAKFKTNGQFVDGGVSFESVARQWLDMMREHWTDGTNSRNTRLVLQDLAANLQKGIDSIEPVDMSACLRKIELRGVSDTVVRARAMAELIFDYGIAHGYCKYNPAAPFRKAIVRRKSVERAAVTEPKKVGQLIRDLHTYKDFTVRHCLLLTAYTFMRPTEARKLVWSEINWDERRIELPAERMLKNGLDFLVPLSTQALSILQAMKTVNGNCDYVFQSRVNRGGILRKSSAISDATCLKALRNMGYADDEASVHGFRATASTLLNEVKDKQGFDKDWIERQLAHVEKNKVRGVYNRAEYIDGRTRMMQWYADYLDELAAS